MKMIHIELTRKRQAFGGGNSGGSCELEARISTSSARLHVFQMAGLEVAGIVLGSIPLIVSALEHYGEGVSPDCCRWHRPPTRLTAIRSL